MKLITDSRVLAQHGQLAMRLAAMLHKVVDRLKLNEDRDQEARQRIVALETQVANLVQRVTALEGGGG